jgi:hypothetical protein
MFVHNNPAEAPKTVTCGSTSSIYTLRKIVKACETFRQGAQKVLDSSRKCIPFLSIRLEVLLNPIQLIVHHAKSRRGACADNTTRCWPHRTAGLADLPGV